MVDIMSKVSLDMVSQAQEEDLDISKAMHCINLVKKPLAQIRKIKSAVVNDNLTSIFNRLTLPIDLKEAIKRSILNNLAQIRKIKFKMVCSYLWQSKKLFFFLKWVLHSIYEKNGS